MHLPSVDGLSRVKIIARNHVLAFGERLKVSMGKMCQIVKCTQTRHLSGSFPLEHIVTLLSVISYCAYQKSRLRKFRLQSGRILMAGKEMLCGGWGKATNFLDISRFLPWAGGRLSTLLEPNPAHALRRILSRKLFSQAIP